VSVIRGSTVVAVGVQPALRASLRRYMKRAASKQTVRIINLVGRGS
jgi:hypothetical protein